MRNLFLYPLQIQYSEDNYLYGGGLLATRNVFLKHLADLLRQSEVVPSLLGCAISPEIRWLPNTLYFHSPPKTQNQQQQSPPHKYLSKISEVWGGCVWPPHSSEGLPDASESKFWFAKSQKCLSEAFDRPSEVLGDNTWFSCALEDLPDATERSLSLQLCAVHPHWIKPTILNLLCWRPALLSSKVVCQMLPPLVMCMSAPPTLQCFSSAHFSPQVVSLSVVLFLF